MLPSVAEAHRGRYERILEAAFSAKVAFSVWAFGMVLYTLRRFFAVGRRHTSPKKFSGGIALEAQATRRPFPCSPALPATIRVPRSTGSGASWRRAESRVRSSTPPAAAQPSVVAAHGVTSYKRGGKRYPAVLARGEFHGLRGGARGAEGGR